MHNTTNVAAFTDPGAAIGRPAIRIIGANLQIVSEEGKTASSMFGCSFIIESLQGELAVVVPVLFDFSGVSCESMN